ncbi:MAG TPA: D-alanyl-D-alanine carboxypeptidase/D-alanyl-D-alanine-endopeptidase [Blastocatellia bacterium]
MKRTIALIPATRFRGIGTVVLAVSQVCAFLSSDPLKGQSECFGAVRENGSQTEKRVPNQPDRNGDSNNAPQSAQSLADLQARVNAIISQPKYRLAEWGVEVMSLDTGKLLVEQNACKYLVPASNAKLFTAALALDKLGAGHRIETSVYVTKQPDAHGSVKGDLIVIGHGDPEFSCGENGKSQSNTLPALVSLLQSKGIHQIKGDLIGDESYFNWPPFGAGWGWEDLQWSYGAEVSALTINENSVELIVKPSAKAGMLCQTAIEPSNSLVTVVNRATTSPASGPRWISVYRPIGENTIYVSGRLPMGDAGYQGHVAVHRPANLFIELLRKSMAAGGIKVSGRERVLDWNDREASPLDLSNLVLVGSLKSRTIAEIVKETLKRSQNLYAQLLLLQVGALPPGLPPIGTTSSENGGAPKPEAYGAGPGTGAPANTQAPGDQLPPSTEDLGVRAMDSFLKQFSPCDDDIILEEGSGLSRRDLVTAAGIVGLLSWMNRQQLANVFRDSLPIAGGDGTLQNRMKDTTAAGNVRAKTGTLKFVTALSGYATTAAGEHVAFSLLLNNYNRGDNGPATNDIDAVLAAVVAFTGHS